MGGGVIKTISFFIDDAAYKAPNGYTFASWVNSSYNTDGYSINSGKVVNTTKDTHIEDVDIDTTIIDGKKYTTVSGSSPTIDFSSMSLGSTFNFGKYQVESEDPWAIEWEIVHQTDEYQIAQTKQIIDLRAFDAIESTNTDSNRKSYGNNNWNVSNIKQFLNSDKATWYSAQHSYDAPPTSANCYHYSNGTTYNSYDTHKGFLYYFSDEEKSLLKDITFDLYSYENSTDGSYTWTGKVWLPTYTQMSGNQNNSISEGTKFDKYTNDNSRIKTLHENCAKYNEYCKINNYASGKAWLYWMSSALPSDSRTTRLVLSGGGLENHNGAYGGNYGLAPCIKLPKTGGLWVKTNSLTWHLNDNIAETATEDKSFAADFTSDNITFKRIDVDISSTTKKLATIRYYQLLNGTMTELLKSAKNVYIYNTTTDGKESIGYYENYRTLVFNELPSGDLLTWLQANATPI